MGIGRMAADDIEAGTAMDTVGSAHHQHVGCTEITTVARLPEELALEDTMRILSFQDHQTGNVSVQGLGASGG